MVTLKDIARKVGFSESYVSRALNNHPLVKPSNRKLIVKTARKMGYFPDRAALRLIGRKTGVIGVFAAGASGNCYSAIVRGIEYGASQTNYSLIFSNSYNLSHYGKYETFLHRVDGLIVFGNLIKQENLFSKIIDWDIPMVIVEANVSDGKANCIHADNEWGGYIATKHLIELGHTRIAHIAGNLEDQVSIDRLKGYDNALSEAGLSKKPELITVGDFNSNGGYQAMKKLLANRPFFTAVYVAGDEMAFGALQAIDKAGLSVPGDISLIAHDDAEFSRYTHPPLTTIRQPCFELGEQAISLLNSLFNNDGPGKNGTKICLTPKLVIRGTTGANTGRHENCNQAELVYQG
jgi:LacI family transcriptional regulator